MILEKPFKILSIDGGGMKGLYSSLILQHLEEEYQISISDNFDLITGTSTGGLIALAIANRVPAKQISKFYIEEGPKIFPNKSFCARKLGWIRQIFWSGKYKNKSLSSALEKILGKERLMSEAYNLLCIPCYNITTGCPIVFKYPHKEGNYHREKRIKMVEVALATSAAPTYLPIVDVENLQCIDGGVWMNNPTLCGVLEAIDHYVGKDKIIDSGGHKIQYTSLEILSISSVTKNTGMRITKSRHRSAIRWGDHLIQTSLNGQSFFADHFTKKLVDHYPNSYYYRIGSPDFLSEAHHKDIDLDKATKRSLQTLMSFGDRVGLDYRSAKKHHIHQFFTSPKSYYTR